MRAHEAFWNFAAERTDAEHLRARRSFCDAVCRKKRDSSWLSTPPGQDTRKEWLALTEDERARRMAETVNPTWPADEESGVLDGRTERKMKRRRVGNPTAAPAAPSASASPNTMTLKCTLCPRLFTMRKEDSRQHAETSPSTPTATPSAVNDRDEDAGTDCEANPVDDPVDDRADNHVEAANLGDLLGELDPMSVAKLLLEKGLPLNPASDPTVAACFSAQALPSEDATSDALLDGWYNQLRSEAAEELRAQKHVVLRVVTDYGATGGFAEARGGRITILLSAPRASRPIYWASFPMVPALRDDLFSGGLQGRKSFTRASSATTSDQIDSVIADVNQLLGKDSSVVATVTDGSEIDHPMATLTSNSSLLVAGSAATNTVRVLIRDAARTHNGEANMVESVLKKAAGLAAFISEHQSLLKLMRLPKPESPILALVREGLLDRSFYDVVAYQNAITSAFADSELLASFSPSQASELDEACAIATDVAFWKSAELLVLILEPLATCLRTVDSEDGVLSHSYKALLTLREHTTYSSSIDGLPAGIQSGTRELVEERWQELRTSGLVGVAFLLDLHFGIDEFNDDDCDTAILNAVRLVEEVGGGFSDSGAKYKYKTTLEKYAVEKARWSPALRTKARGCSAYQWWLGTYLFPLLQDLALKAFSIPTTASIAEAVHRQAKTTRRTYRSSKLRGSRMEKLVFVRSRLPNMPDTKIDDNDGDDLDEEVVFTL